MRQWWLVGEVAGGGVSQVKTVVMCQSVGSSSQTEDFQRSLKVLICCVDFLCCS